MEASGQTRVSRGPCLPLLKTVGSGASQAQDLRSLDRCHGQTWYACKHTRVYMYKLMCVHATIHVCTLMDVVYVYVIRLCVHA